MTTARRPHPLRALALLAAWTAVLIHPSPGRAAETAEPRGITVVGTGIERTAPDTAELTFAVEETAPTAAAAGQGAAKIATRVIEALRKEAGKDARVETQGFALTPVYEQPGDPRLARKDAPPKIVGYTATHDIWVQTRRVDGVGALIDAAIATGTARIRNLSFTVADPAPSRDNALAAAGTDAGRQARAVADALGVRLTQVLHAAVEGGARPIYQRSLGFAMAAEARMDTPVQPGEVTTEVRLQVTYGIE